MVYVTRNPKDTLISFWQFVLKSTSYEDPWLLEVAAKKFQLKDEPKTHVKRLAEFLACPFNGDGEEEVLDEIVGSCSFEKLSNYEVQVQKGDVGDHRNYLNNEMVERIDTITREKFHGSGFMYGS
ncbi:unnamed protein product [Dovyalis caffra]|uniref:Sulfotransferase n=1 Tax=Dovyalis caffra TaxID=77055 RepID=A0AAV1RHF0_9ROSI|nr:unnamed protein product [Dovyalis caffra]